MKRDFVLFLLGAWLLGLIAMAIVAMQNFYTIDYLLDTSPNITFSRGVDFLDSHEGMAARDFLRYFASELNRLFFWGWGLTEIVIGGIILYLVRSSTDRRVKWASAAMLVLSVILTFGITPSIVNIGRELDFVARDPSPPELATFGLLHAAYSIGDGLKLVIGFIMAFWVVQKRQLR